jgi:branched-chain amino acid transport system substrate-binding protein
VIGFEAPTNTAGGKEQLAFAQLAVANDNFSNGTKITLQPADTRLSPSRASVISDQFVARPGLVAVVGPASNREVDAVGPTFARAGIAFVSASATGSALTSGPNPTFFRVVAADSLQGPQEARFIVDHLHPKTVLIIDDLTAYGRQLAESMLPVFKLAKVSVDRTSASERTATATGSVVARITPAISVLVLAWQLPRDAQRFGATLLQQRRIVSLFGPDRLYAPGTFRVAGAYVSTYAPDITALGADAPIVQRIRQSLPSFGISGPPAYAATHVIDEAIAGVCRSAHPPSRSGVLSAVRATNEPTSILGVPIKFQADGDLAGSRWFMYRIDPRGTYRLIPNG